MKIRIAGREIPLRFTLAEMDALQDHRGKPLNIQELGEEIKDHHELIAVLRILAGADAPDADWLLHNIRPGRIPSLSVAVYKAITEGMTMETLEGEEDPEPAVVDVTLEELKKKETED